MFIATEPLARKRIMTVTERRIRVDWAHFVCDLIQVQYPEAEKIMQVMYQFNTHTPDSFYEAFEAREARSLTEKLEIHHTPKHGSWLNIAEIELSVLARQCLENVLPLARSCANGFWTGSGNAIRLRPRSTDASPPLMHVSS